MTDESNTQTGYIPPQVWNWESLKDKDSAGKFNNINRPTAGARYEQVLPRGEKPLQLYTVNTPNGMKVNIMLMELVQLGVSSAEFDAYMVNILAGQQFSTGFVALNPNSKIPALIDQSQTPEVKVFESGAILMYLAEKHQQFIPQEQGQQRAECMSWLMWQMGSAPYLGGGFGHFYQYAPEPMEYPINRFTMEVKRQLDVLDQHLAQHEYLCSYGYSIADMAVWPWYGSLVLGKLYEAAEFLQVDSYTHVKRWAEAIYQREAVRPAVKMALQPINVDM